MSSWLNRLKSTPGGTPPAGHRPVARTQSTQSRKTQDPSNGITADPKTDPNAPERRLQIHQRSLYERVLPGGAFVSAHINRLQHGYYHNKALHDLASDNIYFVSVHFVFHPQDHRAHRFKRANIRVMIHGDDYRPENAKRNWYKPPRRSPHILQYAPQLMYGAVSPENLQWNFSLSSSLGISQAPLSASVSPTGGMRSSYKVFDMMSVQGSLRTLKSPLGPEYDVEDAMAVWTLEENLLQRSGLPREFDFVLLVHKPASVETMSLTVDVDAVISGWLGDYPNWYTNLAKFQPTQDHIIHFHHDIGQKFLPVHPQKGFNFADLEYALEEYVAMPGTVYPTNDTKPPSTQPDRVKTFAANASKPDATQTTIPVSQHPSTPPPSGQYSHGQIASHRNTWGPETLNVRVLLEHSNSPRHSLSPASNGTIRQQSIRRRKSRSELKRYSAQQALHEMARDTLDG